MDANLQLCTRLCVAPPDSGHCVRHRIYTSCRLRHLCLSSPITSCWHSCIFRSTLPHDLFSCLCEVLSGQLKPLLPPSDIIHFNLINKCFYIFFQTGYNPTYNTLYIYLKIIRVGQENNSASA